jgi:hypothetical protein
MDDRWEIWAITQIFRMHPKLAQAETAVDHRMRWFEIHGKSKWEHEGLQDYYRWLADAAKRRFPVYLKEPNDHVPDGIVYPREHIYQRFAPNPIYITCTCSWQIALAIDELTQKYTLEDGREVYWAIPNAKIGIWGIDMMVADKTFGQEYSYQRPSVEYWLGKAMECGIEVYVPDTCDILKSIYPYGDKDDNPIRNRLKARLDQIAQGEAQMGQQTSKATQKQAYLRGAREILEWVLRAHMPGDEGDAVGVPPEQFSNRVMGPGPGGPQQPSKQIQVQPEQMNKIMEMIKKDQK